LDLLKKDHGKLLKKHQSLFKHTRKAKKAMLKNTLDVQIIKLEIENVKESLARMEKMLIALTANKK
jgi:hypothetical protein